MKTETNGVITKKPFPLQADLITFRLLRCSTRPRPRLYGRDRKAMGLVPAVVVLMVLVLLLLLALLMNKALDCKMFPPSAVRAPGRQPPTPSLSATDFTTTSSTLFLDWRINCWIFRAA